MRSNTSRDIEHDRELEQELTDLRAGVVQLSIEITGEQLDKFKDYLRALFHMRGRIHLISQQDSKRIAKRHLVPSLLVRPYLCGKRICDIGSGAGFPGVPLKIVMEPLHLVLFESVRKKAVFLMSLVKQLGLTNVSVINQRAESHAGDRFDTILLRAVGPITKHLTMINRLLDANGRAIFFKTHRVEQELKQAQPLMERLGFCAEVHKLYTPLEQRPLALVVLARTANRRQ